MGDKSNISKEEKENLFAFYLISAMNARLERIAGIEEELSLGTSQEDRERLELNRLHHMQRLRLE